MAKRRKHKKPRKPTHPVEPAPRPPHAPPLIKTMQHTALALAVIIGLNALAWPPRSILIERDPAISQEFNVRMNAVRPRVVFLGNSMLGEGVSDRLFTQLSGVPTLNIEYGGAASAWWYVVLKNVIARHNPRTELVAIFFRDDFLTQPDFRVTGNYKDHIDRFAGADEPVLDRLAYLRQMDTVTYVLTRYWPLYQKRADIQTGVTDWVKRASAGLVADLPESKEGERPAAPVDAAINRVFANENMNSRLLTIQQLMAEQTDPKDVSEFKKALPHSFLPHIVETAKQNDIRLAFVRVKRRRDLDPRAEPGAVKNYVADLRAWLETRGIPLLDYTHDERIRLEHYGEGDHLNRDGQALFTQMLAEDLKPHLP